MKKIRTVTIEVSRTINLGNFESLKITAGISESVPPDENIEDAYERVTADVGEQIVKMGADMVNSDDEEFSLGD